MSPMLPFLCTFLIASLVLVCQVRALETPTTSESVQISIEPEPKLGFLSSAAVVSDELPDRGRVTAEDEDKNAFFAYAIDSVPSTRRTYSSLKLSNCLKDNFDGSNTEHWRFCLERENQESVLGISVSREQVHSGVEEGHEKASTENQVSKNAGAQVLGQNQELILAADAHDFRFQGDKVPRAADIADTVNSGGGALKSGHYAQSHAANEVDHLLYSGGHVDSVDNHSNEGKQSKGQLKEAARAASDDKGQQATLAKIEATAVQGCKVHSTEDVVDNTWKLWLAVSLASTCVLVLPFLCLRKAFQASTSVPPESQTLMDETSADSIFENSKKGERSTVPDHGEGILPGRTWRNFSNELPKEEESSSGLDASAVAPPLGRAIAIVMSKVEEAQVLGLSMSTEKVTEMLHLACLEVLSPALGKEGSQHFATLLRKSFEEVYAIGASIRQVAYSEPATPSRPSHSCSRHPLDTRDAREVPRYSGAGWRCTEHFQVQHVVQTDCQGPVPGSHEEVHMREVESASVSVDTGRGQNQGSVLAEVTLADGIEFAMGRRDIRGKKPIHGVSRGEIFDNGGQNSESLSEDAGKPAEVETEASGEPSSSMSGDSHSHSLLTKQTGGRIAGESASSLEEPPAGGIKAGYSNLHQSAASEVIGKVDAGGELEAHSWLPETSGQTYWVDNSPEQEDEGPSQSLGEQNLFPGPGMEKFTGVLATLGIDRVQESAVSTRVEDDMLMRLVGAYETKNALSVAKLRLASKQLAFQSEQLGLSSEANSIMKCSVELSRSKVELKTQEGKDRRAGEELAQFCQTMADELVAGMCVMLATLLFGGWRFGLGALREEIQACQPAARGAPRSSWLPFSLDPLLHSVSATLQTLACQVIVTGRVLLGFMVLVLISAVFLQRDASDYQKRPAFAMLVMLGGVCGYAGMAGVNSAGGDGLRWLLCWELLICFFTFAAWYPSFVYSKLHGRKAGELRAVPGQRQTALRKFIFFVRSPLFHLTIVIVLPLAGGLLPFCWRG